MTIPTAKKSLFTNTPLPRPRSVHDSNWVFAVSPALIRQLLAPLRFMEEWTMIGMHWNSLQSTVAVLALGCTLTALVRAQVLAPEPLPLDDASGKGGAAAFEEFAKYPPESRPLDTSNWDVLHPWLTDNTPTALVPVEVFSQMDALQKAGLSEQEISQRVTMPQALPQYQFDVNKTILAGTQDELQAKLTVLPLPGSTEPVRFQITRVELVGDDYFGSPSLGAVPFTCEFASSSCTFRWQAPSEEKKYWGSLELEVTLSVEGMAGELQAVQAFYSSPMVAGRFTGDFSERLDNGALVIDAGVEVQRRMLCFVSANLFSVDNEAPLQSVQRRVIVDPSMKFLPLTFFGKIFRDYGAQGAFRLEDLKAQCENLHYPPEWFMDSQAHQAQLEAFQRSHTAPREPQRIYFEYSTRSYVTRRYANNEFSDTEWQSPEKTSKLEALHKLASELNDPALEARKHPQ
jgi:hypothetical protein